MADFDLPAYLARIGFAGTPRADAATLRGICRLHPTAIPFENVTPLTGGVVSLEIGALQAKMVARAPDGLGRGGYCFEQNHLLRHALEAIGFTVTGLAARVLWNRPEGEPTPQTHMALRVRTETEGEEFLADAGFGSVTLTAPLRLAMDLEQETPHETFRLRAEQHGALLLEARIGGDWRGIFRLGAEPRIRADYEIANYYVSTHPESRFRNNLIVSKPVQGARFVLHNRTLTEYRGGVAAQRTLAGAEIEAAMADIFGIAIPDRGAFRRALETLPQ